MAHYFVIGRDERAGNKVLVSLGAFKYHYLANDLVSDGFAQDAYNMYTKGYYSQDSE
tara:strand:+ start:480 stop:650 length:171 start_codon:yes stop_codon:yes gene_type:complete